MAILCNLRHYNASLQLIHFHDSSSLLRLAFRNPCVDSSLEFGIRDAIFQLEPGVSDVWRKLTVDC